ncbi:meiosis protein SPO22/ZIP4 like-domain-containing protein [Emericellopsis atlantica]|uniref:Meiosis protein SPO22/ZIP4 like-domain-containing protein n=1 Tax=Emericellopsis atlantica TaxID=2614577 RepID=A0A9P8CRF7_9HYPO|nr:meiosis protein SPO22/ZIP4 like-domain-containing protein [Emericellopsis atlantica]KAG9256302.1 meiosis protein SPO22/ZIP4 like-domain-containing protein [Emericellopsis atlantica]
MPRQIQDPATLGRERKAQAIIADIRHQLHVIASLSQKPLQHHIARSLEREGRDLWNLCIKLKRERKSVKILPKARLLAFHVLELGRMGVESNPEQSGAVDKVVYFLGLLLTLGRICLAENDLGSGRIALQKGALYVDKLKALQGDDTAGRRSLEAGHVTLHMALSWREGKLDVAEHMFAKAIDLLTNLEATSAEDMADTLRHIGADLSDKKDYAMGTKWLWRAYNVINTPPLDHLSMDGLDNRLAICQSLVQSLLGMNTPEATAEANNLVAYVESEVGDKPIVLHWRLEILQNPPSDVFEPAPMTFDFLLHHVKKLSENSVSLACGVMDELITQRVLQTKQPAWIDKTIVRRVWMSTMATNEVESDMEKLATLLDVVLASLAEPLSVDVAGAAQSLICKKIEAAFVRKQYAVTESWCRVALHGLFANCGSSNKAKFGRKRMLCTLELNELDAARAAFSAMEPAVQDEPLSQYLFFKTALRSWDTEAACQSIRNLAEGTTYQSVQDLLYACIREAQQVGDKICTLTALKASSASCLTSVVRCSLRLITMLKAERSPSRKRSRDEPEGQEPPDLFVEDACVLFELGKSVIPPVKAVLTLVEAAERARLKLKDHHGDKIFTVPELHWFRKNAYNMGVAACTSASWTLSDVVRIFAACLVFCDSYPKDIPQQDRDDILVMSLRTLVSLARTEDSVAESLQRYLETREHVAAFDGLLENASDQQHATMADLRAKASTLYVFDFEAATALRAWDDVPTILRRSESCRDESCLKAMGDCLLRSEAPARVLYTTLRLLINSLHALSPVNASLLTKYIRTLFHAVLPLDDTLALTLIDQVVEIAAEVKTLPETELEWLVARTFNHAIDYYARGEEENCHIWAMKGMALSGAMSDGGVLRAMLEERFAKLRFEEPARKGVAR